VCRQRGIPFKNIEIPVEILLKTYQIQTEIVNTFAVFGAAGLFSSFFGLSGICSLHI
jgi:hypothetical protein